MVFNQGILRYVLALQLAMFFSLCKASVDEILYDVSGSRDFGKAIAKVDLPSPVHFYNEKFTAIYAHTNGYVTFADEKIWIPSYFSQNKVMAPCMVEIQDNNDLGSIRIAVTSKEEQLNRANYDVYTHFAREKEFRAKTVVVVSWDGLLSQETTIQNVLIIGEVKTFALFLFKNRNGFTFDNSVQFLEAQAGFSSGDSVRLTELLDARRGRHIEYLFKSSNTLTSGKWMFLMGSPGLFQVQMPHWHPVYNPTSGRIIPQDTDECKEGLSVCHRFSDCFNVNIGYKCNCTAGYFGNGRVCIRKYSIVNLEGKVTGKINDVGVGRASLAAQVSSRNGDLVLSIDPVTSRIGHSLKMLPAVAGIIGWLFGKSSDGSQGISTVGNRFKATSIITFNTGEILHIAQHMKGYDSFNSLVFDTDVQGDVPIPLAQPETLSRIGSYAETYAVGDNMKMYSEGTASYIIDDLTIGYKINREISFEPVNSVSAYRALVRISNTETSFFQDSSSGFLRYRQKYAISVPALKIHTTPKATKKTTQAMPKPTSTMTEQLQITTKAKPTASIFAKKEPETKPTTGTASKEEAKVLVTGNIRQTSNFPGNAVQTTSVVRESPEITMQPTKPALPGEGPMTTSRTTKAGVIKTKPPNCEPQKCAENAICKVVGRRGKCVCNMGFIGNGTSCIVDKRISCGSYMCDEHSECIREQSQYFCKCKDGYIGDGLRCFVDTPCECHKQAECYNDAEGAKYCVCKLGFKGDGYSCVDIDECQEMKIICQSHSRCVNSIGSYKCVCNQGFRKNGTQCLDIPECTEMKDACGDRAICTEIPGSFQCSCPKGFHFGYRKRNCFPNCPRCLNGGTCVGKFGCRCAPGYSGEICQWVGDEFLLYSQGGNIKRFSYPYGSMSYGYIYRKTSNLFVGVDYDCRDKKVYWTDITLGSIHRSNYDGTAMETVIEKLGDPQGLTIDWLGRNMFWTDNGFNVIQVSRLDGKYRKVLFKEGITHPRPIVCNPYTGQLFWADWDRRQPRIEVASMDGTGRRLLASRDIVLPNGLTIDYKARDLCWTDAALQFLSCINLDGRNQRHFGKKIGYPFGITMHNSMMYWTNWVTDNIGRFDKQNNEKMPEVNSGFGRDGRILDIKSVTACPSRKNICSLQNGGCRKLCLPRIDGGRTCY